MDIQLTCNTDDEQLFSNVRENAARPLHWLKLAPAHDGHAILVGGGPSLAETLGLIKRRRDLGQTVFALNGACGFLNRHGIVPDYQVILDARPDNITLLAKANEYLIASQCDPELFEAVNNVTLWHPGIENIDRHLPEYDDDFVKIGGGTSVGLSAMCLVYAMGYRKLHLFGYDSSHRDAMGHAYSQPINDRDPLCKVTMGGKEFTSSLTMAKQAELFPENCNNLIDLGCTITVDGGGLIRAVVDQMRLHRVDPDITEQAKYQKMWDLPIYRENSPGERFAREFVTVSGTDCSDHVIEFGCGTGRGGRHVAELTGCSVTQIDLAENCRDAGIDFPFVVANLAQPIGVVGDVGYCTDVMEHIPPDDVDAVIRNIMACVPRCFFKIALFQENMGPSLIGHQLHLSVFPFCEWENRFRDYTITYRQDDGQDAMPYATFYVQRPAERT